MVTALDFSRNQAEYTDISHDLIKLQDNLVRHFQDTPKEQNMQFLLHGLYFGYPVCCIEAFLEDIQLAGGLTSITIAGKPVTRDPLREEEARGGFIPCIRHAEELRQTSTTIEDLVSANRICPYDFPNQSPLNEKGYNDLYNYALALQAYINKHEVPSESFDVFLKTLNTPNNSNHDSTNPECICEDCR